MGYLEVYQILWKEIYYNGKFWPRNQKQTKNLLRYNDLLRMINHCLLVLIEIHILGSLFLIWQLDLSSVQ